MPAAKAPDPYTGLDGDFSLRLHQLAAAVNGSGGNLNIASGFRSSEQQSQLYNAAIAKYGPANARNWAAPPGQSNHEKGLAADLNGDSKSLQLAHQMAPQFGLNFPLPNEAWHVEPTGIRQNHDNGGGPPSTYPDASNTPLARVQAIIDHISGGGAQQQQAPDQTTDPMSVSQQSFDPRATGGPTPYDAQFQQAAQQYGISPSLLKAVAKQESGFNPNARSGAGAVGLMQFMPNTARGLGINPSDPTQAINGAARLLSNYIKQFGSVDKALAAYNAGPGAVQKYGGVPPFAETQNYVKNITSGMV